MTANRLTAGALALGFARELAGRPYVWGGTWPTSGGTDCSGLWQYAYDKVGVYLPRTTYGQYLVHQIPNSWPSEPGDLYFVKGSDSVGAAPGHVMGFVSAGRVFQAEYTGGPPIGEFPYDTRVWEYRTRPALALPLPPGPTKNATPVQVSQAGLVVVSLPKAKIAMNNGWPVYHWGGLSFDIQLPLPRNVTLYANHAYMQRRPKCWS